MTDLASLLDSVILNTADILDSCAEAISGITSLHEDAGAVAVTEDLHCLARNIRTSREPNA